MGDVNPFKANVAISWTVKSAFFENNDEVQGLESECMSMEEAGVCGGQGKWSLMLYREFDRKVIREPGEEEEDTSSSSDEEEYKFGGVDLRLAGVAGDTKVYVDSLFFKVYVAASSTWEILGGPLKLAFCGDNGGNAKIPLPCAKLRKDIIPYVHGGSLSLRAQWEFEAPYRPDAHSFLRMLQSEDRADCTLISTDGNEFRAHRLILTARSSVFKAMFKDGTKEQETGRVDTDMDDQTLIALLEYIYAGSVTKVAPVAETLMVAADYYGLTHLKELTIRLLTVNFTIHDVMHFLTKYSSHPSLAKLTDAATQFVLRHPEMIFETEDFRMFGIEFPVLSSVLKQLVSANRSW